MRLIERSITKTILESLYESEDAVYNHLGERCPKCGSGNYFEVDGAEYDDGTQEFKLVCADCGYESSTDELNNKDLNEAEEVKEDDTAELKESAANEGITLKDYAMNYFDGDIDMDVTDTEVDMLVAFVYDFNEEPKDNYDRFLNLLGERTKVVKVGNNVLTCDFSSVFKPYEDKLQGFFDMDYSEFNEAWAEAVSNLEALVSGNAGEKTYKELIDILTSRQVNESASYEDYTDKDIIEDVIDNFKEITGKEVKDVLNYDETVEGFFKQGEVESTGESIINYLTEKGLSRSHIDELLYKLDDELTSLWNKL